MKDILILDGAMGTMLQRSGQQPGEIPEVFGMEHPEILADIHEQYIQAGSRVIYANTFNANARKLAESGHSVGEVITANVKTALAAAAGRARVAVSMGPIGELLAPLGTLRFEEAYEIFREMVCAGRDAGAELVVFETFSDLYELKAAVLAAKEHTDLPVWTTMSFEATGRTFLGTTVASMASTMEGLGVDAMGINCSLGPAEILPLIREMRRWTDLPLIVKPNAGLPDPRTGDYAMDAAAFADQMGEYRELGVSMMGGCCGTDPSFIRALSGLKLKGPEIAAGRVSRVDDPSAGTCRGVCAPSHMAEFGGVHVIGERINPTGKKKFQQALRDGNMNYIMEQAIQQQEAGADILDVNVGLPDLDEPAMMRTVVRAVQSVVDLPVQIDSSNPAAIEAGLRAANGRAIVNSVNGETEKMEAILPLVKKYGAAMVALTMDEDGIPTTAEKRVEIAHRIICAAERYGIPREDILVDCLTLTVSAQQEQAMETLRAMRILREEGCHLVLGVSNISFGLPARIHVNRSFLTMALYCGLDFAIVNPNQKEIMDAIYAFRVFSCEDENSEAYIERFKDEKPVAAAPVSAGTKPSAAGAPAAEPRTVEDAILKGLKEETASITRKLLTSMDAMALINEKIIPALDLVGAKYETGELFLPQLINAANAACAGLDLIKERLAEKGTSIDKEKIILATVKGDIHDIGKNIVKVVLENYGYQVIDLGRDVDPSAIVEKAIEENVRLIGLSALMTTTVGAMEETIRALHEAGHDCQVMVGGAVLTEEYAGEIGADCFVRDAKASADAAKKILG